MTDRQGIYIHVPFCLKKCLYCDFCSYTGKTNEERAAYAEALLLEMAARTRGERRRIDTVFFGGGTPTVLGADLLVHILKEAGKYFDILPDAEITLEANPATATQEDLRKLRAGGFNRISVGVQSLCDVELAALGRLHSAKDALAFLKGARRAGFERINADVMFAIPNQTEESLRHTLEGIVNAGVGHISVYGLMLEEGTPFWKMQKSLPLPSEDEEERMALMIPDFLSGHGFAHYEISNYAKKGEECRHNLRYWRGEEYFGFGAAAHSYLGGERFYNGEGLEAYLAAPDQAEAGRAEVEDAAYEYVMLRLRLAEGIRDEDYFRRFGVRFSEKYRAVLDKYLPLGHILEEKGVYRLSEAGMCISNAILVEMLP